MPEIVAGDQVDVATITEGFNRGYADYKYSHTFAPPQMTGHLARLRIAREDCAILTATEDGEVHGAGIAFLAVHDDESWCGGLAVDPAYRRHRWGAKLMQTITQRAIERGLPKLWLEVLHENHAAQALYQRLGFSTVRDLQIWEWRGDGQVVEATSQLRPIEPATILSDLFAWHDQRVCWQRSPQVLTQMLPQLRGSGLTNAAGEFISYLLYRAVPAADDAAITTVRLLDVAVNPAAAVAHDGRALIQALQAQYPAATLTLVNESAESWLNPVLAECGFAVVEQQYEMVRALTPAAPHET